MTGKKKMFRVSELMEGDRILIEGQWRTFSLATPSLIRKGEINIMVSDGSRRFFRVKGDDKFERKPVEA